MTTTRTPGPGPVAGAAGAAGDGWCGQRGRCSPRLLVRPAPDATGGGGAAGGPWWSDSDSHRDERNAGTTPAPR